MKHLILSLALLLAASVAQAVVGPEQSCIGNGCSGGGNGTAGDVVVFSQGIISPEDSEVCVEKPCYYTQTNLNPPIVWVYNGTNNGNDGWAQVNEKSAASLLNVSLQDCSSGGICPNERGAWVIDPWVFWSQILSGGRDADGTHYVALKAGTSGGAPNAVDDFLTSITTITLATSASQFARVITVPANTWGTQFCRGSVDFEPCNGTATSAGTCTVGPDTTDPEAFVVKKEGSPDEYAPVAVSGFNGCVTTSNQSVALNQGLPFALASGDSMQRWSTDGLHPYTYYHRWLADLTLNASEEFAFYPAVNLLPNGTADTACTGGTWTVNGTGSTATQTPDATSPAMGGRAIRGARNCYISGRAVATDGLNTEAFSTTAGRIYTMKGFARINGTANGLKMEIIDQGGTALNTTEVQAYHIYATDPITLTAETTTASECNEYCYFVVKFRAGPSQTTAKLRFSSSAAAESIYADEWIAYPAITQNLQLNPLIKDGRVAFRLEGDSRSDADATPDFPYEFDLRAGELRTNLEIVYPLVQMQEASGGRKVQDIVSATYSTIRGGISDYTILYAGINDTTAGRTPAQLSADILSTVREIRKAGSTPIVLLDPPYGSNVDAGTPTTWCNSTYCSFSTSDMISILVNAPGPY